MGEISIIVSEKQSMLGNMERMRGQIAGVKKGDIRSFQGTPVQNIDNHQASKTPESLATAFTSNLPTSNPSQNNQNTINNNTQSYIPNSTSNSTVGRTDLPMSPISQLIVRLIMSNRVFK